MGKLSKKGATIKVDVGDDNVKITVIPEEIKSKIARPGDSMYLVAPYPVIDPSDVDDDEIHEEDIRVKPIVGYSYTAIMVKSSILTDDLDENIVNGDYKIPLYKNNGETNKKLLVFNNEDEAITKYKTLMNVSITEATRRETLNRNIKENLEESLTEMFH